MGGRHSEEKTDLKPKASCSLFEAITTNAEIETCEDGLVPRLNSVITAQIALLWVNELLKDRQQLSKTVLREICQYFEEATPMPLLYHGGERVFNWDSMRWGAEMTFSERLPECFTLPLPGDRIFKCSFIDKQFFLLTKEATTWNVNHLPSWSAEYMIIEAGVLYYKEILYFFGGEYHSNNYEEYTTYVLKQKHVKMLDLTSNTWSDLPSMKIERGYFTPHVYNRRAYLIGGCEVLNFGYMEREDTEKWGKYLSVPDQMEVFNLDTHLFEDSLQFSLPKTINLTYLLQGRLYLFKNSDVVSIGLDPHGKVRRERVWSYYSKDLRTRQPWIYQNLDLLVIRAPIANPSLMESLLNVE